MIPTLDFNAWCGLSAEPPADEAPNPIECLARSAESSLVQASYRDETMALSVALFDYGPALPFERQYDSDGLVELTLEQFASMYVELEAWSDSVADIARRYGCTIESAGTLQQLWAQRLGREPALLQRFRAACSRYREWLQAQCRAETEKTREAES